MPEQPQEQPSAPAPVPVQAPPAAEVKKGLDIKSYILIIAVTLIAASGGMEVFHAYQTGQPINWEVMEKILDRLTALASPPEQQ